jgi:folate-binding protein YgfZ
MLQGILTNRVPEAPLPVGPEVTSGTTRYAAVLTPKGRMVTDVRVVTGPRGEEEGLLLEVPASGLPGLLAHLAMYVPPRFAKVADVTELTGSFTVAGPGAAALLSREGLGLRVETAELEALAEGEWRWVDGGGAGVLAIRSGDLATPAFDVVADRTTGVTLAARLLETGATELTLSELDVLRVETGRPLWGVDMDQETLLPETGLDSRAVDHTKGCYTGQEVIVRIRDRGHVNRRLRAFRLGGTPLPERGAELWMEGRDHPVGAVTSAVLSPRAGGGIALGYLRREVEVPGEVRLGGPAGPRVQAVDPEGEWWRS